MTRNRKPTKVKSNNTLLENKGAYHFMASVLYSLGGISFQIQQEKIEISKRFLDKISYF